MHVYAAAADMVGESTSWLKRAVDEARRVNASFIIVLTSLDAIPELIVGGFMEDAIETGVLAGRGMVVSNQEKATRENFDGHGVDLAKEFQKLPLEKRRDGDAQSLIRGVIPAAMWIVHRSLSDASAAISMGRRVAAVCRQLADDGSGAQDRWLIAAKFFELSSVARANAHQILAHVRTIEGDSEGDGALRVVGLLLATWHAAPSEAIQIQLRNFDTLMHWFKPGSSVYRLVFSPYIESFWWHVSTAKRFTLRCPNQVEAALRAASESPEAERVGAVLQAACNGFRIQGIDEWIKRARVSVSPTAQ
jgi:hypothetical protein